tara:strand:- start:325 stop:915 length:591 start_codon:yes stop_codon:yes gene_type:complete
MNFISKKRKLSSSFSTEDEDDETKQSLLNISTKGDTIYFYEDVDTPQILELISQIKFLQEKLSNITNAIIHLHLYSYGGDAHLGFSMYDFIKSSTIPIYTYVDGMIASAATFIYLAGTKRFMTPNSTVLIHQISTQFWGKYEVLKDECKNMTHLMKLCKNLYSQNTSMKKKQIDDLLKRELFLTFDECTKINFTKS